MEKFDILDKNGELTGQVADKGTDLQDGQYYLCYPWFQICIIDQKNIEK
jgi:hypothetical protein